MNNNKGFSLIEAIVAMGIMSLGVLTLASMSQLQNKINSTASVNQSISVLVNQMQQAINNNAISLNGQNIASEIVIYNPLNSSQVIAQAGLDYRIWRVTSIKLINQTLNGNQFKGTVLLTVYRNNAIVNGPSIVLRNVGDVYCTVSNGVCIGAAIVQNGGNNQGNNQGQNSGDSGNNGNSGDSGGHGNCI